MSFQTHNPLVSLLGMKNLKKLPAQIQRFQMRLMRFIFTVVHTPGKDLIIANILSRAPTTTASDADTQKILNTALLRTYVLFTNHRKATD